MVGIHGKNDTAATALPESREDATTTSDTITNASAVNDKNSSDWKMLKDPMAPYEPSRHLRYVMKDDSRSRPAPRPPGRPAPAPTLPLSFLPWHPITPPLCPPKNETVRYLLRYLCPPHGAPPAPLAPIRAPAPRPSPIRAPSPSPPSLPWPPLCSDLPTTNWHWRPRPCRCPDAPPSPAWSWRHFWFRCPSGPGPEFRLPDPVAPDNGFRLPDPGVTQSALLSVEDSAVPKTLECPKPKDDKKCAGSLPVVCYQAVEGAAPAQCRYDTACRARAAGFADAACNYLD
jgi:hypothetical protein